MDDDRAYLLPRELGGQWDPGNLVPVSRRFNRVVLREPERLALRLAEEGHRIEYEAVPEYEGDELRPVAVHVRIATVGRWRRTEVVYHERLTGTGEGGSAPRGTRRAPSPPVAAGDGSHAAVEETWARIEAALPAEYLAALRPGATEDDLLAAEAELGARLPEPYRRSLLVHDGQDPDGPWLLATGRLCSLEDMLDEWRWWTAALEAGELDAFAEVADPDPAVRGDRWWRPGWLPVAASEGDHLVLDLDPSPAGRAGQVFAFSHETGPGALAAPDFASWLETFAEELEEEGEPSIRTWPD